MSTTSAISQLRAHKEASKDELIRHFFSLPNESADVKAITLLGFDSMEINAVLTLQDQEDSFAGRLYLFPQYLCFASLDRKSVKFTVPLYTIRRVERLKSRAGIFALSLVVWHGMSIIVQLTSLRHTADLFCNQLREALKVQLQLGRMKTLKVFVKTLYSEVIIPPSSTQADKEREDGSLIKLEDGGDDNATASTEEYLGGLGLTFKFPGDAKKLREASKVKLWAEYFRSHGRHLTLLRYPKCTRLVQVGLPNRLRGELWETLSGSIYLRFANPGLYVRILKENEGKSTMSTEEIEKDLNRSLPEYSAYQSEKGIDTLRRVLTAYSWKNPEVGYCQAMNILVAAILIYMSEEQAFWLLEVLCDRLVPGYYSPSMYGTLLDQRVFEALVQRCLPIIHDHFQEVDVQLSVASLPWFLSLFINSMPMIFAFRVVDCFFAMGPKVLFQVGLAILKINGEKLLQIQDDGGFIHLMREYFASLGDSAHPYSNDPRVRAITNFQELLLISFREFSIITDELIASERRRFRSQIISEIEAFSKRAAVRNLKTMGRFTKDRTGLIYDVLFKAVCDAPQPSLEHESLDANGRPETRIGLQTFKVFLSNVATWARDETIVSNGFQERYDRRVADHDLINRLFYFWDTQDRGTLTFQDLVTGLDGVMFNDLMANIEWFFTLHDKDKDGSITKDEVLQLSESLLFIFRYEIGDGYLASVGRFLTNAFEFGDALLPHGDDEKVPEVAPNQPYLTLATFRMVVLADEVLESFFETDFSASFKLEPIPDDQPATGGFLGDLISNIVTEDSKNIFNKLADGIGKTMGKHKVNYRPSIGKTVPLQEPKMRESIVSPSMRKASSSSNVSQLSASTSTTALGDSASLSPELSTLSLNPAVTSPAYSFPLVQAVTAAIMERTTFAIDEAKDEEGEEDEEDVDLEDGLLEEVDAFLEAHDSGLTGAEAEAAKDLLHAPPMK
ncbi:hypothetical protein BOTBODRAFT_484142 [Botryobasidium botryosum FD-172 SS1]|uniref:Rab-GAP TBC domain-containing protein n=1 Tax=Botryobasidium botryosum (strain FD-172 SS1) TaxID=930990 RepID=A0A067MU13_BOTB1|nr:hypothetical protein BOTBODRAFT_484142 [Botryobasidium botryosum FD-172 SS1]